MDENAKKEKAREFFEKTSETLKKCVFVPGECSETPTSAHSISRSKILVPMAQHNDILYELDQYRSLNFDIEPYRDGYDSKFNKTNPRKASIFPGLCNTHDRIFNEIDNKIPSSAEPKGLFLLAYRTLIHSYWMNLNCLNKKALLGEDIEKSRKSDTIYFRRLRNISEGFVEEMHKQCTANNWNSLEHKFIIFENHSPTIAANSFQIDYFEYETNEKYYSPLVTNIFPVCGDIVCVFSYPKQHRIGVKISRPELFNDSEITKKKYITSEILRVFNVMLFSPEYYESLTEERKFEIHNRVELSKSYNCGEISSLPNINWHLF